MSKLTCIVITNLVSRKIKIRNEMRKRHEYRPLWILIWMLFRCGKASLLCNIFGHRHSSTSLSSFSQSLVSYGVKISLSHDKHRKHSLITVPFPSPVQVVQFSARHISSKSALKYDHPRVLFVFSQPLYTCQNIVIIDTCHEPIFFYLVLKINSHI